MRKTFRISKNELSEAGKQAFHPLWYRDAIELGRMQSDYEIMQLILPIVEKEN